MKMVMRHVEEKSSTTLKVQVGRTLLMAKKLKTANLMH